MTDSYELREGSSLAGRYALEHCIRQDGASAFYAVRSVDNERLLAKLTPKGALDAERQFEIWQRSRHLRHANLLYLRDLGHTEQDDAVYFFAIFEYPDDALSEALRKGPLSEPEAIAVFEAALAALRYLHVQGMVHGAVDADHIVAVGDHIKLTTDALHESHDLAGHLEDIRQLGVLARAMRAPEPLGEPLESIARHATMADPRQRWTLAEIARTIEAAPRPTAPSTAIESPSAAPEPPQPVSIPIAVETANSEPEPEPENAPRSVEPLGFDPDRQSRAVPKWPFVAAAVLLLFIVILHGRHKPEASQSSSRLVNPATAPSVPAAPVDSRLWRVVAFAFRSRHSAAREAQKINRRWPDLHASVVDPKERHGQYRLTLGSPMMRDEAVELQRRARSVGVPADTELQE